MKKATKFLTFFGALCTAMALATFGSIAVRENTVEVAEAAQHIDNFDSYTYSGTYYNSISESATEGMSGSLRQSLTTLINPKSVPSYSSGLAQHFPSSDADPTNSSNMVYLYTRNSLSKTSTSWNREHVWPKSLSNNCWKESRAGADLLHLRPTYNTCNSTRSSIPFGEVSKTSGYEKVYQGMTYAWSTGSKFMPLDATKGDVARIIMYVWVAYYDEYGSKLPAITSVFESFNTLINWHVADKPDVLEGNRNNYCEASLQKNRNPFVDHPEYAWKIFGSQCSPEVLAAAKAAYPAEGGGGGGGGEGGTVTISETSKSLITGETFKISANSSDLSQISWSTTDSTVASLSQSSSTSGSEITITAVGAGSANIYASALIGGKTAKAMCAVEVKNQEDVDVNEISLYQSDFGTYTQGVKVEGFASSDVGQYSCIQFANGSGVLRNTAALGTIQSIDVTVYKSAFNLAVYGGATENTRTTEIPCVNNHYDFSSYSYPYFVMACKSGGVTKLSSITIKYKTGGVQPEAPTLSSISVSGQTTVFTLNDEFEFDGVCTAQYSNGNRKEVIPTSVSSPLMSTLGNKTVTITYQEGSITKTTTYTITVNPAVPPEETLESISVSNPKTEYEVEDPFEKPVVTAHYSEGATKDVTDLCAFDGYDLDTPGDYTVEVIFEEDDVTVGTSYEIHVKAIEPEPEPIVLSSITLSNVKTEYLLGDRFVRPTVTAHYSDDNTEDVTDAAVITGYDLFIAMTQTVTVSYTKDLVTKIETYQITVTAPTPVVVVTPISIDISGDIKSVYNIGDELVKPTIIVTYSDDSTADVTEEATFSGFNSSMAGSYTITISYTEDDTTLATSYRVRVDAPAAPSGCSGNIEATCIILSTLSLLGIALILINKRKARV